MKKIILIALAVVGISTASASRVDWLLNSTPYKATVKVVGDSLIMSNGLMERIFLLSPTCATVGLNNLMTSQNELRAVRPEAQVVINKKSFNVGGLYGQPVSNYLNAGFVDSLTVDENGFNMVGYKVEDAKERLEWKRNEAWLSGSAVKFPDGKRVTFTYKAPENILEGVELDVVYEIYDGAPIMSKWLVVRNNSDEKVVLNSFVSELLAMVETAPKVCYGESFETRRLNSQEGRHVGNFRKNHSSIDAPREFVDRFTQLFVVTDYAMGGTMEAMKDNPAVNWTFDHPDYEMTGIRYYGMYKPALLKVAPPLEPTIEIEKGQKWNSFTTYEMLRDASDRERLGLAECRFWRLMSPWSQENPILMHVRSADVEAVKNAIDQSAEVGFEMVIMTFGSGFNILNKSEGYLDSMKMLNDYAKSKGIALGGYSLLASRGGKDQDLVISPKTGKPATSLADGAFFGKSPCIATDWGTDYFKTIKSFFEKTGMNVFENDGAYPGDVCASITHAGHRGYDDSQYSQWQKISNFYNWCRKEGVYLNVPDWSFLLGGSKTPMGYVETNWSLPRAYQEIIERQNIYDGTWQKTPTMGFMFVPLTQYHGGGAAATIEPLNEHIDHYERRLQNLFGAGVQACFRGPRLYDTESTKAMVTKWVNFYKNYRDILDSDLIHLRRPDGNDYDGVMHVNPNLQRKGFVSLYNPTDKEIKKVISLPLYYTGLSDVATVKERDAKEGGKVKKYRLNRDYSIDLEVVIPPHGYNWYVVE